MDKFRSTTILAVRHQGGVAIGGDGQVTLGNVVMKSDAHKIRRLHNNKVITGLKKACEKRPVSVETLEEMASDIESALLESGEPEVASTRIGEQVMQALKGLAHRWRQTPAGL